MVVRRCPVGHRKEEVGRIVGPVAVAFLVSDGNPCGEWNLVKVVALLSVAGSAAPFLSC